MTENHVPTPGGEGEREVIERREERGGRLRERGGGGEEDWGEGERKREGGGR